MAKTKSSRQYTSRPKFLHRFSQKQLTAMIVMLGVSVLGVWTLLFSSAATTTGSVDFVLLCPPAGQACSGSSATLHSYATSVQSWYTGKLGSGRTFKIHAVSVKYAPHATSYYSNGGSDANDGQVLNRVAADLGIVNSSTNPIKTQVVTGFRVFTASYCGYSYIPGAISVEDGVKCPGSAMPQLIAHELGHSFGLQHVSTLYDFMNPNACFNGSYTAPLSSCTMSSTQRSYLLTNYSGWFPAPTTTTTTTSTTCSGPDRLTSGQSLTAGQSLHSSNCNRLYFGADGNLSIRNGAGSLLWQSYSANKGGTRAIFQSDGNFVVYTAGGTPIWNTATAGHGGTRIVLQSDANLVIYTSSNVPLWASKSGRAY